MAVTRQWLIEAALSRLGVAGAGQAVAAEDAAIAGRAVDAVVDELASRRMLPSAAPDAMLESQADHVAALCARRLASSFGVTGPALELLAADAADAERGLYRLMAQRAVTRPLPPEWM